MAPNGKVRPRALLLVLSGNMLIDALEVSTAVIVLPSVAKWFAVGPAASSMVMIAFAAAFGGSLIGSARLTQRHGRRSAYLMATLTFALASLVAGFAPTMAILIATRIVKGVCVAMTAPTGLGIIATTFPEGPARVRAMSVYALFGASGFTVGLVASGLLTTASWRWAMAAGAPIALVLFVAAAALIPRDEGSPVLPPAARPPVESGRLIRAALSAAALNGCFWGFLVLVSFELQTRLGLAPWVAGLALVPASLPLVIATPYMGRWVARRGTGGFVLAGAVAALAGYGWYFYGPGHGYAGRLLPAALLIAAAFVLSFAALNLQAVSGRPPQRQPRAAVVFQTAVQAGGALVLAAIAAVPVTAAPVLIIAVAAVGLIVAAPGAMRPHAAAPIPEERDGNSPDPSDRYRRQHA